MILSFGAGRSDAPVTDCELTGPEVSRSETTVWPTEGRGRRRTVPPFSLTLDSGIGCSHECGCKYFYFLVISKQCRLAFLFRKGRARVVVVRAPYGLGGTASIEGGR